MLLRAGLVRRAGVCRRALSEAVPEYEDLFFQSLRPGSGSAASRKPVGWSLLSMLPTKPDETSPAAIRLYEKCALQALQPEFYENLCIAPTYFYHCDLCWLHVWMVVKRIHKDQAPGSPLPTTLVKEIYEHNMRAALILAKGWSKERFASKNNLLCLKHFSRYDSAMDTPAPESALAEALKITVFKGVTGSEPFAAALANYSVGELEKLGKVSMDSVVQGEWSFGKPPSGPL